MATRASARSEQEPASNLPCQEALFGLFSGLAAPLEPARSRSTLLAIAHDNSDARKLVLTKNPPEICRVGSLFSGSFLASRQRSNPLGAIQLCSERLMATQRRVSSFRARTRLISVIPEASFRISFLPALVSMPVSASSCPLFCNDRWSGSSKRQIGWRLSS